VIADFTAGVDQPAMDQAAAVVYRQLYPKLFTGSQHVAKDGLEFDVSWNVTAPPKVVLEPPAEGRRILHEHLLALEPPAGVSRDQIESAYADTLENTTFQLVMDEMTMTVKGEGGEGTAPCRVTIFAQADSADGTMTLRPIKAVGTTSNESDEWFLNAVILPAAMELAEQALRGIALPALSFVGVALTPPAMLVTPSRVVAMANLAGRPVPVPAPEPWPESPFFALLGEEALLRVARVATAGIAGTTFGKTGSVDIGIGDAHYGATAIAGGIEIAPAGRTEYAFRGAITGNVNAGIKIGCTNFGVNYTLLAQPTPTGRISLSIDGTTVRARTTHLDTFVLVIVPHGDPVEWIVSALTTPLLQVVSAAFAPLITKLFEGIQFDVWRIPSIPIDVAGVHLTVAPQDVHFAPFGAYTTIEGTASITGEG